MGKLSSGLCIHANLANGALTDSFLLVTVGRRTQNCYKNPKSRWQDVSSGYKEVNQTTLPPSDKTKQKKKKDHFSNGHDSSEVDSAPRQHQADIWQALVQ
jgi:hypothetical protein